MRMPKSYLNLTLVMFFLMEFPGLAARPTKTDIVQLEVKPVVALPQSNVSFEEVLNFADHLFADGDYYRAITEYRRYLFLVKGQGDDAARAACAIGEALFRGEQYEAAAKQWDEVAQRASSYPLRHQALYSAGLAYLHADQSYAAKPRFRLLAEDEQAEEIMRLHAQWLLAWGHLDSGELSTARIVLEGIAHTSSPLQERAKAFLKDIEPQAMPQAKSPLAAGLLSVVPGGGHFYLGQWQVGLTSLIWSGGLMAASAYSALQQDYVMAGALGVVGLGWYSGGVYGAIAGAMQHNRDLIYNWREKTLLHYGEKRQVPDLLELKDAQKFSPGTLPHVGFVPMKLAPADSNEVE